MLYVYVCINVIDVLVYNIDYIINIIMCNSKDCSRNYPWEGASNAFWNPPPPGHW